MKRILITGFSGFVGRYFIQFLESRQKKCSVFGIDLNPPEFEWTHYNHVKCSFRQINLLEKEPLETAIFQFQPDYILHLASYSSVGYSWKNPVQSFSHNTNIFLNLLEVVRSLNIQCRILSVGSSEEYGNVSQHHLPLLESYPVQPLSPYAVARVAQEHLSKVYVEGYNLDIIMTRSFNHFGAYQKDIFVVPSFARKLVELSKTSKEGRITTGDVSIIRDFVDVRDVVRAYYVLFEKGEKGEIYNICSNRGTPLQDIIEKMASILDIKVSIDIDTTFIRPNDNKIIIGSNQKLKERTGWQPVFSLDESLSDIIKYWKQQITD